MRDRWKVTGRVPISVVGSFVREGGRPIEERSGSFAGKAAYDELASTDLPIIFARCGAVSGLPGPGWLDRLAADAAVGTVRALRPIQRIHWEVDT